MAKTPVTGVRLPSDILTQIDKMVGTEGDTKSEVIVTLLRRALGMETGADTATVIERIDALEKKLLSCLAS